MNFCSLLCNLYELPRNLYAGDQTGLTNKQEKKKQQNSSAKCGVSFTLLICGGLFVVKKLCMNTNTFKQQTCREIEVCFKTFYP